MKNAYLVHSNFLDDLKKELNTFDSIHENLIIKSGASEKPVWAKCIAEDLQIQTFKSVSEAVKILKSNGRNWALYSFENHRRAKLIQEQLPKNKFERVDFLQELPTVPMGFWTLLDANTIAFSAKTNSVMPLGNHEFNEDKSTPPSRAYLKLWELFTFHGVIPKPGSKVIDFGSCPGGWTWVLQQVGCHVTSIDKAPLDPKIAKLPNINFVKADAFSLKPQELGPIDWFFSDIICYPPKLLELVKFWKQENLCHQFVCTIKFQGETDYKTMQRFRDELGAEIVHLYHNKHEVTAIIK